MVLDSTYIREPFGDDVQLFRHQRPPAPGDPGDQLQRQAVHMQDQDALEMVNVPVHGLGAVPGDAGNVRPACRKASSACFSTRALAWAKLPVRCRTEITSGVKRGTTTLTPCQETRSAG